MSKIKHVEVEEALSMLEGCEFKDVDIRSHELAEDMGLFIPNVFPVIIKKDGTNPCTGVRVHVIVGFGCSFMWRNALVVSEEIYNLKNT